MIDITLEEFVNHYANNSNIQNLQPVQLTNLHTNELKILSHKLDQYDEILQNTLNHESFSSRFSWIHTITNFIIGIIVLIFILKILKCYQRYCICRRQPLPIRNTTTLDEPENVNCGCFKLVTECFPGNKNQPISIRSQFEVGTKHFS